MLWEPARPPTVQVSRQAQKPPATEWGCYLGGDHYEKGIYSIGSHPYLGNSVGLLLRIGPKLLEHRIPLTWSFEDQSRRTGHRKGNVSKAQMVRAQEQTCTRTMLLSLPQPCGVVRFRQFCLITVILREIQAEQSLGETAASSACLHSVFLQWHPCQEVRFGERL